jgi:hypothetical protein
MNFCSINKFRPGFTVILVLFSINVLAHIKNESSQFPDIEFSDSQFEIVLLVGAGIIPETPVFEPDLPLSRTELGAWAALASGLAEGGETPDLKKLSAAAVENGLLDSLIGDATYSDINSVLFQGVLTPESADSVPDKGEAASFIASNLTTGVNGETLLDKRSMRVGPSGEVTAVESRMNPDGGSSYYLTVAGETYPLYSHGRVANGPTDLIQWQGRTVRRSFLKDLGDFTLWIYLEAEPVQVVASTNARLSSTGNDSVESGVEIATNHNLLYGLIAAVLFLGVFLFFRSKRS